MIQFASRQMLTADNTVAIVSGTVCTHLHFLVNEVKIFTNVGISNIND